MSGFGTDPEEDPACFLIAENFLVSDSSQGAGWWLASDGRWYPPSSQPAKPIETAPPRSLPGSLGQRIDEETTIQCPGCAVRYNISLVRNSASCPNCNLPIHGKECPHCSRSLISPGSADCRCPQCGGRVPADGPRLPFRNIQSLNRLSSNVTAQFDCPICTKKTGLDFDESEFTCSCGHSFYFVRCKECLAPQPVQKKTSMDCRQCGTTLRYPKGTEATYFGALIGVDPRASTLIGFNPRVSTRELQGYGSPIEKLGPLVVIDGAGWSPPIGSTGYLWVFGDRIEIGSMGSAATIRNTQLLNVSIDGSTTRTGGGFIGGGFGAKGAVEGMLVSSALNALTTKTAKWVVIEIAGEGGWVSAQLNGADVLPIKRALRGISDWVIANRSQPEPQLSEISDPSSGQDLVSQLERLGTLLASGVLTPEEFQKAKSRLLND